MPPLTDAVGLVDGHQGDGDARKPVQHPWLHQPLGRDVEQVELAGVDGLPHGLALGGVGVGVQPRRRHPRLLQRRHLVGHQGDQRRDHQAQPRPDDRGDLIAEALAAPGWQHRHGVVAGQHRLDDLALVATEVGMAEHLAQHLAGAVQGRIEGHGRVYASPGLRTAVRPLFPRCRAC